MRHRGSEPIPAHLLAEALARTPLDHHVIWTGREPAGHRGSLRSRAFGCVREIGVPIGLRELLQRAARIDVATGLDPDAVRSAVRQHQTATPAVLLLVRRLPSADFVAVADIPFAGDRNRRIRAGEMVLDRLGRPYFSAMADAA